MRLPGERFLAPGLLVTLVACAGTGDGLSAAPSPSPAPTQGPAADYPVTIGAPYAVSGVTYTPVDTLNYDQVGPIAIDPEGGSTISASHHTLPVPSYVEVTSLETGRTILVRVERRGPMDSNALLALSAGAVEQLGANATTPVRVRRVNPPEQERALLRAGQHAPVRMDTPMSLVEVLKRKLPGAKAVPPAPEPTDDVAPEAKPVPKAKQKPAAKSKPPAAEPQPKPKPKPPEPVSEPEAEPPVKPKPEPKAPPAAVNGKGFVIQAGAFSSEANAQRAAKALGGQVSKAGSFHIVRTGPFATKEDAQASLAKVRAAGYSDARIQTKD